MAPKDWFRNEEWNATIEAQFFEKLRRARDKAQYLCIQSGHLAKAHPEAALELLKRYFALGEDFHMASAFLNEAAAYLTLGRIDEAIRSYRKALEREREFPNLKTAAWSEYALLIATESREPDYDEVLQLLEERKSELMFPVERFKWHAANALIRAAQGHRQEAKEHAIKALDAARTDDSGFRYHPKVGLVGSTYEDLRNKLVQLSGA